jgi:hypothetical protein
MGKRIIAEGVGAISRKNPGLYDRVTEVREAGLGRVVRKGCLGHPFNLDTFSTER